MQTERHIYRKANSQTDIYTNQGQADRNDSVQTNRETEWHSPYDNVCQGSKIREEVTPKFVWEVTSCRRSPKLSQCDWSRKDLKVVSSKFEPRKMRFFVAIICHFILKTLDSLVSNVSVAAPSHQGRAEACTP